MKRIAFAAIFLAGCGVVTSTVEEASSKEALLERAWERYSSGNYESASATFDSVLVVDAEDVEAHLGKGFTLTQLTYYQDAYGSYDVTLIIEDNLVVSRVYYKETLDVNVLGDRVDTTWTSQTTEDGKKVWRFRLASVPDSGVIGVDEFTVEGVPAQVLGFDGDYLYLASENMPFSGLDTLEFRYTLYALNKMPISKMSWYAIYGKAVALQLEGSSTPGAAAYAWSSVLLYPLISDDAPERVNNALGLDSLSALYYSAYAFFKDGNYGNAVYALHIADPAFPTSSWDINDPASLMWCYDSDNLILILQKIEQGLGQ